MGRIFVGIGFSMAPAKLLTTEDTEDTGDFLVFFCNAGAVFAAATARRPPPLFPSLFFSVRSVGSGGQACARCSAPGPRVGESCGLKFSPPGWTTASPLGRAFVASD